MIFAEKSARISDKPLSLLFVDDRNHHTEHPGRHWLRRSGYIQNVGTMWVHFDPSKNAKAILDKYKDEQFPFGLALPIISNQKMNHYLKDLGELCGFTTPITIVCYRAGQ